MRGDYDGEADEILGARQYARQKGLTDPYRAYAAQRNGARLRSIEWQFTFSSWWAIWRDYFHLRGTGKNNLCMAREKDEGPYSPGNVYLTTNLGNLLDYRNKCPRAIERRKAAKEARESKLARMGSRLAGHRQALISQIVFNASSATDKYACNQTEGEVRFE